jgi:hypothetical protein
MTSSFRCSPFSHARYIIPVAWDFLNILTSCNIESRLVGGCVRDALVGIQSRDIDIAVAATPQHLIDLCIHHHLHFISVGREHGTIRIVYKRHIFDVTCLRADTQTNGRHAIVHFGTSFEHDATRRDFTINALYVDRQQCLYDAFNGVDDLENGIIRFIGNPHERLREDYLRIMRYFRCSAHFSHTVPRLSNLPFLTDIAYGVCAISRERIWSEWKKMIIAPHALNALKAMHAYGLISFLFHSPCMFDAFQKLIILESTLNISPCPIRRTSALIETVTHLLSYPLSRDEHKKITCFSKRLLPEQHLKPPVWLHDCALVSAACSSESIPTCITYVTPFLHIPPFPITGQDLLDIGFSKSKTLGDCLHTLHQTWIASSFQISREALLQIARKYTHSE